MKEIRAGDRIIGVVAQKPIVIPSSAGARNIFCTLQPLAVQDGRRTEPDDFPNRGLVWWLLTEDAHRFATPGRLVSFSVEHAPDYNGNDPEKHFWQVKRDSVKPCTNEIVEVINVPSSAAESQQNDLVSVVSCDLDHPPCITVLVRWQNHLYGYLRTNYGERNSAAKFVVKLSTLSSSGPFVNRIPAESLDNVYDKERRYFHVDVALDALAPSRSAQPFECHYELIPAQVYKDIMHRPELVRLESDADLLRRIAKDILGWRRKERARLRELLERFDDELTHQHEYSDIRSVTNVLDRAGILLTHNGELAAAIAEAVIKSGSVDHELQNEIESRYEEYVESRTAKTATDINTRLATVRDELDDLRRQRDEFESASLTRKAELERELELKLGTHNESIEKQRAELKTEKQNLDIQRQMVERLLTAATMRFEEARDSVIEELLTLAPLLNRVDFYSTRTSGAEAPHNLAASTKNRSRLVLRGYLSNPLEDREMTELAFFDRFEGHVQNAGYVYRRSDLVAFHVSVKVSDLTVLGGVSGTGKSSLPRLYAQALAGEVGAWDDRYRMVGVNPSWLDVGDLLGRVNVLDRSFVPSDSGLYDLLIHAHHEFRKYMHNSGLYIVCLDEMNLAQVEHYFSPFLQVLEAPLDQRKLRCFAREAVSSDSSFAQWAEVDLPPSLRFIGTVNFDETTRSLSLRVLDRVNLITLHPGPLSELDEGMEPPSIVSVSGPAVTLGQFNSWKRRGQAGSVAELFDGLREPLARLGCPLSPRRYRAVCEFIASTPRELATPEEALDMQITQRLLPQIRGLFRPDAREALEDLRTMLAQHGRLFTGTLRALDERRETEDPWIPDDTE